MRPWYHQRRMTVMDSNGAAPRRGRTTNPTRRAGLLPGLLLLAGVGSGCASTPIRAGAPAPQWTLADTEGVTHSMSDYRGRVVLMDFWATWCSPCKRAAPHIQDLADRYGDEGLVVLGFQHQDGADPRPYLREHGYTYTTFPDADAVARSYGAGLPSFIIVDRQGVVALHQGGYFEGTETVLEQAVTEQLAVSTE